MNTFPNVLQPPFSEVFRKDYFLKGKWHNNYFKNNLPINLELGCGKGEYTVGLAGLFPGENFIGIDIKGSRMWSGANMSVKDNIRNVCFLRTRIEFINSFFGSDEIKEIWITFPDPQLKKAGKRLTSSGFLNMYRKLLHQDGWVNLKTDSADLFNYTFDLAKFNHLEIGFVTKDLYATAMPDNFPAIQTYYEKMWLADGLKIHFIRFKISCDHDIEEPYE
jgi:tRNA (guanine-N7-)-methyltransferase